jgi:hypothetical protein
MKIELGGGAGMEAGHDNSSTVGESNESVAKEIIADMDRDREDDPEEQLEPQTTTITTLAVRKEDEFPPCLLESMISSQKY